MTKLLQLCSITGMVLLSSFCNLHVFAQNFNYVAAASRITSAQSFNMQMRMMNSMNMMHFNYKDNMFTNNKLTFQLKLKDSVEKEVKSKIYMDTVLRKTYIIATDKSSAKNNPQREQRIYPAHIQKISIESGEYEGIFLPKLTTDSCWMFRVIDGEINVYSNALAIVALQKHDGAIVQFNLNNLHEMVKDDPKASKFYDKKDYLKAINKYNSNHEKPDDSN